MWKRNGKPKPKSYAELLADAQRHWADVAAIRAQAFEMIHQDISNSPDVKMRPDPSVKWSMEGVACAEMGCGGTQFYVTRWVTVNGVRHRFEGKCASCSSVHTYDWETASWVA